jgi:AraC-like DNA-binding protein
MSGRTLQRRLTDEGTRFADVVDAARRERALLLPEDATLSCTEIAFLLGYTEPAPFFRAFKRWTGMPPQALLPDTDEPQMNADDQRPRMGRRSPHQPITCRPVSRWPAPFEQRAPRDAGPPGGLEAGTASRAPGNRHETRGWRPHRRTP